MISVTGIVPMMFVGQLLANVQSAPRDWPVIRTMHAGSRNAVETWLLPANEMIT